MLVFAAIKTKNPETEMTTEFRNEPLTDFTREENAVAMRSAIEKVKRELGREYPLVIGGARASLFQ